MLSHNSYTDFPLIADWTWIDPEQQRQGSHKDTIDERPDTVRHEAERSIAIVAQPPAGRIYRTWTSTKTTRLGE